MDNDKIIFSRLFLDNYGIFIDEIDRLQIIREMFSQYSDKHIQNSITKKIRKIHSDPILIEMANSITKKEKLISSLDLLKIHLFSEINRSEVNKIKIPDFGRNMIITHLVSSFETYLRKNLRIYHSYEPKSLITDDNKKNLNYKQILSCKSYDEIIIKIIEKELDNVFQGGIDDIDKYLENRLTVNLRNISKFSRIEWNQFREIFYRRNIIIHNAGITNEKYNINNKRNIDTIELIDTNDLYVNEAIKLFLQSASTLKDFFTEKL